MKIRVKEIIARDHGQWKIDDKDLKNCANIEDYLMDYLHEKLEGGYDDDEPSEYEVEYLNDKNEWVKFRYGY